MVSSIVPINQKPENLSLVEKEQAFAEVKEEWTPEFLLGGSTLSEETGLSEDDLSKYMED